MIKLLTNTKIAILGLLFIILFSILFRQSIHSENTIYRNYDATYHTLLTIEALDQTPASQHHFLPIVSLGSNSDKYIKWGATIPDKYGNYYYTSFPLGGFIVPYSVFKIFNLDTTVENLFIFSSFILTLSVILVFFLTQNISRYINNESDPNIPAFLVSLIYIFSMETLYSHGYIYWGHSLMQPIFIFFLYLMFKIFSNQDKPYFVYLILFFSFLLGFTEWSGYLIVFGAMVGLFFSKITKKKKYIYISVCAIGGAFALFVFILDFLITVDPATFFHALKSRFFARNITTSTPLYYLLLGYLISYIGFLILLPLSLIVGYRKRKEITDDKKNVILLLLIIIAFGLLENVIMKQHAVAYHFDRLKLLPLFAVSIPFIWISKNTIIRAFTLLIVFTTALFSLYMYPTFTFRISENIALSENKTYLKNSNFNKECSSCILGISGSVRGYTNLLFLRGVYEHQTEKSLELIAKKINKCACYIDTVRIGGGGMIKLNGYKVIKGVDK